MTRGDRLVLVCLALYYCAAMLTGTYFYQHRAVPPMQVADSLLAGAFWPVYWTSRAALKITE